MGCVTATAKRRRRQAKFDPRYKYARKDSRKRALRLAKQIENERRMSAGKKKG